MYSNTWYFEHQQFSCYILFTVRFITKCAFITFTGHSARLALLILYIINSPFPVKWNLNVSCFQRCNVVLAMQRHSRLSPVFFAQNKVVYMYLYTYIYTHGLMSANMLHARVTGRVKRGVERNITVPNTVTIRGENKSAIQQRFSTKTTKTHTGLTSKDAAQIV